MKFLNNKKQLILSIVILTILTGFIAFRYLPLKGQLEELEAETKQVQKLYANAQKKQKTLPEIEKKLNELETRTYHFKEKIPGERSLGSFLQQIAELMDKNGLKDHSVQPRENIENKDFAYIPLVVDCKGELKDIFNFFRSVEELERLVKIEEVTLNNSASYSGELEMSAKVYIFYQDNLS